MYPQIFGKYVLQGELASGGMARVFVATLRGAGGFEKRLAVKQIRPELVSDPRFVERFIQEAKTAVELTHPNIVPVYELGVEGGVYYIAMELCAGITLAELLAAEGALGLETGAYVGVEVARALDYAHRRGGIVHQDVTPRNVLIDDEGAVRLIDFGIARPVSAGGAVEVFGSPGYMPPEQVRGATLTPAADVFALGALVIEACTGVAPFRRATERESLAAVETPPERPSANEPALEALDTVLLAAVAPNPQERLQNIDELGRALREALRGTDLGDLARELGRRVRRIRRASQPDTRSEPPASLPSVGPSIGSPTRTFATRRLAPSAEPHELVDGAAELAAAHGPVTRPLQASPALADSAPSDSVGRNDAAADSVGRNDTAADSASSNDVAPSDTAADSVGTSDAAANSVGTNDTAADSASSNDATSDSPTSAAPRAPASKRGPALVAAAVALAALGFLWSQRGADSSRVDQRTPAVARRGAEANQGSAEPSAPASSPSVTPTEPRPTPALPTSSPSASPAPPSLPSSRPVAPPPPATTTSSAAPSPSPSHAPSSTTAPPTAAPSTTAPGTVLLTAAPPAQVTIAGRRLTTPVDALELPAGDYQATFTSPTWDGPISARVHLEEGAARHVHADFTSEPPRVVVK